MELMARYPDDYFDLAIVDPPYGINMDNQKVRVKPNRPNSYLRAGENQYKESNWDKEIPTKEYFIELNRVSKNQIIWGANYFCEFIPSGKGWIYWDKQMGDNNFSSGEFAYQSLQIKSSSFSFPSMRVKNTRIHPTQKPVELYKWLLNKYATCKSCENKGWIYLTMGKQVDCPRCNGNKPKILDTHLGSGTTAISCIDLNFDLTACELDKDYFDKAMQRINNHLAQQKLF